MKIFTSQPVLCHAMFVACRLVVHLLIFVTWRVAHGRRCWVEDTSLWLCRHFNDKPAYKLSDMLTHRGNVAVVWKLEFVQRTLQKKKTPLGKVLASGFDHFSSLSAHIMQYCHLGDYCSGFLRLNSKFKWLHLCLDGMVWSEATTAEGMLAALEGIHSWCFTLLFKLLPIFFFSPFGSLIWNKDWSFFYKTV